MKKEVSSKNYNSINNNCESVIEALKKVRQLEKNNKRNRYYLTTIPEQNFQQQKVSSNDTAYEKGQKTQSDLSYRDQCYDEKLNSVYSKINETSSSIKSDYIAEITKVKESLSMRIGSHWKWIIGTLVTLSCAIIGSFFSIYGFYDSSIKENIKQKIELHNRDILDTIRERSKYQYHKNYIDTLVKINSLKKPTLN